MSKTTTTYHMAVNISGMLRNMGRRKIKFMQDDDGNPVSDAEARQYIECP
jgi:carbon monoxide dehydrogenase subunit G